MKITEKLHLDYQGLIQHGPINIVAFGDSVTHGALLQGNNYETVYWNRLKQMINRQWNYVPVNVINAGIGGITAEGSLGRMQSQVLDHHPDLVIVCFGLNDVNFELDTYISSLKTIFSRCQNAGVDVVFLTPNMLNTYVAEDTLPVHLNYAAVTADMQNSGKMDRYMDAARELAASMNVPVADCYAEWKELSKTKDVTGLLINRINHPTAEMHELFARKLFEVIFADMPEAIEANRSTMIDLDA